MTLTELRYIVALASERHFGRAAEKSFVSQPTLSVAIKKLEDELGVTIFERQTSDITVTPLGERIVEQAQRVLEESRQSRKSPPTVKTSSLRRCAWASSIRSDPICCRN